MNAKIKIRIGKLEVEYDGPSAFLDKKLLSLISDISSINFTGFIQEDNGESGGERKSPKKVSGTLATFIKASNARSKQWLRFLATAAWLHGRGQKRLLTKDISKALSDNSQKRLGNPSEMLTQNVTKGYCEKEGASFFVTEEGYSELGV
ncbi:MAG: hypothetical protein E3J72_03595 [Planctomycetota bacterium]|nr:MAG: hypothetical protein E3J72_03595 [Planctomycetota bacterium]